LFGQGCSVITAGAGAPVVGPGLRQQHFLLLINRVRRIRKTTT